MSQDRLEVDLGDSGPGITSADGHRDRDARLGVLAKVDRAEPDTMGQRFGEARLAGIIRLAADDVSRQPGDLELLFSRAVELDQLDDRRHLAQQAGIVAAAQPERTHRPFGVGRPADVALDLLDELRDPLPRRVGLLLLDDDERRPVFPITEPEVERSVDQHYHADQADKHEYVFTEELAARNVHSRLIRKRAVP